MARTCPRRRTESGYTLVEVVIAMLLTSVMVTSVFSVALTAKSGGGKGERSLMATQGAKQISNLLKNFVTGDTATTITYPPGVAANGWGLTGVNGITDTCPDASTNCWALAPGTHTLAGVFPAAFEAAPYSARVTYFVAGGSPPNVIVTATWTEP
jgi:type II secretory pathway pseudopilin PulG